jgi:hypothetical protein
MEKKTKKDFRWRYQTSLNSQIGKLLNYIHNVDSHPTITTSEMIIKALSAYYLPNVYSPRERSPEELKRIAYESVFALQSQIEQLMIQFDLDTEAMQSRKPFPIQNIEPEAKQKSSEDEFDDDLDITNFTYSA